VYLFEDSEIRSELQDFHIRKVSQSGVVKQNNCHDMRKMINDMSDDAKTGSGNDFMNAPIMRWI